MATLADLVSMGGAPDQQWVIRRANDQSLNFVVKLDGTAVDLTSCTGTCLIKADYSAGAATIATATVSFPTPASGTVKVLLTDTTSALTIPAGTADTTGDVPAYVYDVKLTLGSDIVTVLRGTVLIQRMVS
jgi:hypothetical protein